MAAAFGWFSHPSIPSLTYGLPVSLLGLALRAWAAGHLAKDRQLTTSGPYRFLRNPLYIGTLLVALGLVIASRSAGLGLVFAAVFFLIYLPAIQLEEQHLNRLFPDFAAYSAQVPALLPNFRPGTNTTPFRPGLYLKNREYEALLGFFAGAALLVCKTIDWR